MTILFAIDINRFKGSQSSLDKKFCSYVERVKGEGTGIFCSKHHTSILDSNTREVIFKPMMKLSKMKLAKRKERMEERNAEVSEDALNDDMDVENSSWCKLG